MYSAETTIYPMLGVGAFFVLFWVGFAFGDLLGWACDALLILGFLLASIGAYLFARAEVLEAAVEDSE